jgi:serine/threonine-protein kinase
MTRGRELDARPRRDPEGRRASGAPTCRHHLCIAVLVAVALSGCGLFERGAPRREAASPPVPKLKVVVLPFVDLGSGDESYLAAGLSSELADRLRRVGALTVLVPSDATPAAADPASLRGLADELNASFVLTGSTRVVRAAADEPGLAVAARLVRARDGVEVWGADHERRLTEVFEVQSAIALAVVDALAVTLTEPERRLLESRPTSNVEAYEAYLRGVPDRWTWEARELEMAGRNFARAVELDPGFALAHAASSENHSQMFHFRYDRSPGRLAGALAAARTALEIDPSLSEGHRALGLYYYWGQRNFGLALNELNAAAAGRPGDPVILSSIGVVLRRQGRWEEALEALRQAAAADPWDEVTILDLAGTCARMRRWDEALAHCGRAIELAPDDIFPYVFGARILRGRDGDLDEASGMLDRMPDKDAAQQAYFRYEQALLERDSEGALRWLAQADDQIADPISEEAAPRALYECECRVFAGSPGPDVAACLAARAALEQARELSPGDATIHASLGWSYALLGDRDRAVAAGERALQLLPPSEDAMAGHSTLVRLAKIYARVGEPYRAVKFLQKALLLPGWISPAILRVDPAFDPLRRDPRFAELMRIHGVPG